MCGKARPADLHGAWFRSRSSNTHEDGMCVICEVVATHLVPKKQIVLQFIYNCCCCGMEWWSGGVARWCAGWGGWGSVSLRLGGTGGG